MADKIFISYRRDDVPGDARELRNGLTAKFGRANVFMDIEDLLPGEIFDEKLEATFGTCDVLIAVIGPRWLEQLKARAAGGGPDYVRQEIAWALARKIVVIPVLVGRTGHMPQMPSREDLPEDIRDLVRRQKHDVAHERFGRDLADLVRAIVTLRRAARPPRSAVSWRWAAVVAAGLVGGAVLLSLNFAGGGRPDRPKVNGKSEVAVAPPPPSAPPPKADPPVFETPPPLETRGATPEYQDNYELPANYQPMALAYLAAPYVGNIAGPASTFRIGVTPPGDSLFVRFVKRGDGTQPWEGLPLGLFKRGVAGQPTMRRLTVADSSLSLDGMKALHPTLYAFVSEDRPVAGLTISARSSDHGRKASETFAVLSDTSFLLLGYLDGPNLGMIANLTCVNKRSAPPSCEDGTGEVVEDPLSGGPAMLMIADGGPPKWLKEVPTGICVERQQGLLIRVPGSSQPVFLDLPVDGRWCSPYLRLNYLAVREEGIRIGTLEAKKRLDSRSTRSSGWRMWAERPTLIGGRWVQRIVLRPPA